MRRARKERDDLESSLRGSRKPEAQESMQRARLNPAAKSNCNASLKAPPFAPDYQLRAVFDAANIGIAVCSLNGDILEANAALSRMFGYTKVELSGKELDELQGDECLPTSLALKELGKALPESSPQEGTYRRKNGSEFWGRLALSVAPAESDEPAFMVAILEDITEYKRIAEKSREAEKMEVIGRLAGGIAHDFNNLLTGVLLYCDLLSEGIHGGSAMLRHVEEIRLAGEQGAALTHQLLAMARKETPRLCPVSLNEVISSTENMLRRLIGEQIELVTTLAPGLPQIRGDQGQLRQVLLNLVLNARDAMPQGGRVTVRTCVHSSPADGAGKASLFVEDTGCGMGEKTCARIFEPFFTTKHAGHGTGLGLATVRRIVEECQGEIKVESKTGHGTRIEASFPTLGAVLASGSGPKKSGTSAPSNRNVLKEAVTQQTILLVDDHASARTSIQSVLHHAGFRVLPAASGKQALKIFSQSSQQVGLLLADWTMPGMSGCELASQMRQQKPELKVLLISGHHDPQEDPPDDAVELIRKPFAGPALLERVRAVMNCEED
jgi:two-component system, cell cycle sensor histidine kinase and response regulator CckA